MKIYSVDFEMVIKNYKKYVEKMLELDQLKMAHYGEMESIKNEMEKIVSSAKSGLIIDENLQRQSANRFKELQSDAQQKDGMFREAMSEKQNDIMESSYEELSKIIEDYSKENMIDMVISKAQVIFLNSEYEITEKVIDILKEKELYYENTLTEVEN